MREGIGVLLTREEVQEKVRELAREIAQDLAGEEVTLLCILKGSVFFAADLARELPLPVYLEFMRVESYGAGTASSGRVKILQDVDGDLAGKNVLVVEDILDSGHTLRALQDLLSKRRPKTLRTAVLLDKPSRREREVQVEYRGFEVPDVFVVGYGLDYAQQYRNLPYVGYLEHPPV